MSSNCFHCGLPVVDGAAFPIVYQQVEQTTCCVGCQAVAQSIIDAGLDYYYAQRTVDAEKAALPDADILAQLRLYDLPDVQHSFVYAQGASKQATLLLDGITCAACVWLIEQSLLRMAGVTSVSINYSNHRLQVSWQEDQVALSEILLGIQKIGYQAQPFNQEQQQVLQNKERKQALVRLWIAGLSMMQVMMYAVPTYLYGGTDEIEPVFLWLLHWASMVLTLPVVVYSAIPFYQGAMRDWRNRRVGMDTPISLAIVLAFGASMYALLSKTAEGIYFDSISMFVFLLLGGRYLEHIARRKAADATERLSKLIPAFCHVLPHYPAQDCQEGLVAHLKQGDVVLVRAGEVFPVDGCVLSGSSEVNQALLTGESIPVLKEVGQSVQAGTLNVSSPVCVRATGVGQYTRLSSIVRLLDGAMAQKPKMAQMADRYASVFVALLLVLAALTMAYWWWASGFEPALWVVVSLLVITCPCALSLATPTALAAATGFLANRGLLISRGHSLETLAHVTDVVFDKTGTLTTGQFAVTQVQLLGSYSAEQALKYGAALEQFSEHPLAQALVASHSDVHDIGPVNVQNTPGHGLQAEIDGLQWAIGRPVWVAELFELGILPNLQAASGSWIALGNQQGLVAYFCLEDTLKPDINILVRKLQNMHLNVHVLSGDGAGAVNSVAQTLNIAHHQAEATPESKLDYVKNLQQQGKTVLMVGDGINDAPVLVQADVSIAVEGGADVAQAGSDLVMVQSNMGLVALALQQGKKTRRIIQENLLWAAVYNAVAVPIAMMGFANPWIAALGMAMSSLLVTVNAMRLLK